MRLHLCTVDEAAIRICLKIIYYPLNRPCAEVMSCSLHLEVGSRVTARPVYPLRPEGTREEHAAYSILQPEEPGGESVEGEGREGEGEKDIESESADLPKTDVLVQIKDKLKSLKHWTHSEKRLGTF